MPPREIAATKKKHITPDAGVLDKTHNLPLDAPFTLLKVSPAR